MRILFLSSSFAPQFGGAAISESTLSAELSKRHDVVVLSRRNRLDEEFAKKQGVKNILPFSPISVLFAFLNPTHPLNKEISSAEIFHLNGHWFWENYFFSKLCRRHKVPYVLHPRGMLWVQYRRPWLKRVFNFVLGNSIVSHASKVILLSDYEREQVQGYPLRAANLIVIPNGINEVKEEILEREKKTYFIYLGRLEPRKNLEFLIRAFQKVNQTNKNIQMRLVGPVERHYDQRLKNLIHQLRLEKYISIETAVYGTEKDSLLRNSVAVVYPSQGEPFGRTIFEAFAAGTLCLVPENSGGAEYVERFAPGMLYPDCSDQLLAKKMLDLVELSEADRKNIVDKASSWVSKNLSWAEITEQVLQIYRTTLEHF